MAAGTEPLHSRAMFRDLSLEELHAARDELNRRITALTDSGISRREAELRVIAGAEPIVEGEPVADTALRFAILPASLEERVAALEECIRWPLQAYIPSWTPLTVAEQLAELRESIAEAAKMPLRVIPAHPPLSRDEICQILRECVTVVKPGETLVIQGQNWGPSHVREIQDWMDAEHDSGRIGFKVLAVIGDEMAVAEARP